MFVKDIYVPFFRTSATDRQRLITQRVVTVGVGVAATVFALMAPSIIDALLLSYNLWAPTVVVPLIAGVVWGLRSPAAGLAAILAGGVAMAVWLWGLGEPLGVSGLVAGVAANIVVFATVYLLAPRQERLIHGRVAVDSRPRVRRRLIMALHSLLLTAVPLLIAAAAIVVGIVGLRFYLEKLRE